jgi:hypothetical protein
LILSKSNPNTPINNEPDIPYVYSSITNCSNIENTHIEHTKNILEKVNSQQTEPPVDVLLPVFDENAKETLNVNRYLSDVISFISMCIATNCSRFYAKIKNWILRVIGKSLEV